ncbi:MAG: ABC transporter permease [SAR86 cluster bacterium]|nr:ABC transporter permease [SAR86 cluster bacterium]
MKNFFLILSTSYKRDLKNYLSYKFNIFGEIFLNFLIVFSLFYISYSFKDSSPDFLANYENNYFLYLLFGVMVLMFLTRTFSSLIFFVSNAQALGFFESIISTKSHLSIVLIGSLIFPMTQAVLRVSLFIIFSQIFEPGTLSIRDAVEIIFIIIYSFMPFIGISFMIISLLIIFKRASFVSSIFLLGCAIFSGIFFPISSLPIGLQILSKIFPTTFSIDLLRGRILEDISYGELYSEIIFIALLSCIYFIIGIYLIDKSLLKAKKEGTITHY